MASPQELTRELHDFATLLNRQEELRARRRRLKSELLKRKQAAAKANLTAAPHHDGGFLGIPAGITDIVAYPSMLTGRATKQIAEDLIGIVPGTFHLAKDVGKAAIGDRHALRQDLLGMGKAYYGDVRHPLENIGHLAGDIFTLGTAGAGSATRLGALARATAAERMAMRGERVAAKATNKHVASSLNPRIPLYEQGISAAELALPFDAPTQQSGSLMSRIFRRTKTQDGDGVVAPEGGEIKIHRLPEDQFINYPADSPNPFKIVAHTDPVDKHGTMVAVGRRFNPERNIHENQLLRLNPKPNGDYAISMDVHLLDKLTPETERLVRMTVEDIKAGLPSTKWRANNLNQPGKADPNAEFGIGEVTGAIGQGRAVHTEQAVAEQKVEMLRALQTSTPDELARLRADPETGAYMPPQLVEHYENVGHEALTSDLAHAEQELAQLKQNAPPEPTLEEQAAAAPVYEGVGAVKATGKAKAKAKEGRPGEPIEVPQSVVSWAEARMLAGNGDKADIVRHLERNGIDDVRANQMADAAIEHLIRDKGIEHPNPKYKLGNQRSYKPEILEDMTGDLELTGMKNAVHHFPVRMTNATDAEVSEVMSIPARSWDEAMAIAREKVGPDPEIQLTQAGGKHRVEPLKGVEKAPPKRPAEAEPQQPMSIDAEGELSASKALKPFKVEVFDAGETTTHTFYAEDAAAAEAMAEKQFPDADINSFKTKVDEKAPPKAAPAKGAPKAADVEAAFAAEQGTRAAPKAPSKRKELAELNKAPEYTPKKGKQKDFVVTVKLEDDPNLGPQPDVTLQLPAVDKADAEAIARTKLHDRGVKSVEAKPGKLEIGRKKAEAKPKAKKELPTPKEKAPPPPGAVPVEMLPPKEKAAREAEIAAENEARDKLHAEVEAERKKRAAPKGKQQHEFKVSYELEGDTIEKRVFAESRAAASRETKAKLPPKATKVKVEAAEPRRSAGKAAPVLAEDVPALRRSGNPYFDVKAMTSEGEHYSRIRQEADAETLHAKLRKEGLSDIVISGERDSATPLQDLSNRRNWLKIQLKRENLPADERASLEKQFKVADRNFQKEKQRLEAEKVSNEQAAQRKAEREQKRVAAEAERVANPAMRKLKREITFQATDEAGKVKTYRQTITTTLEGARKKAIELSEQETVVKGSVKIKGDAVSIEVVKTQAKEAAEAAAKEKAAKAKAAEEEKAAKAAAKEKEKLIADAKKTRIREISWQEQDPGGPLVSRSVNVRGSLRGALRQAQTIAGHKEKIADSVKIDGKPISEVQPFVQERIAEAKAAKAAAEQAARESEIAHEFAQPKGSRSTGTNPRALTTSKAQLLKLAVPEHAVQEMSTKLTQAVRAGASNRDLAKIFTDRFGDAIGNELYGHWEAARRGGMGGSEHAGRPLRAGIHAFLHPTEGVEMRRLLKSIPIKHKLTGEQAAAISPEMRDKVLKAGGGKIPDFYEVKGHHHVYVELSRSHLYRYVDRYALNLMQEAHRIVEEHGNKAGEADVQNRILKNLPDRMRKQQLHYWDRRLTKRIDKAYAEQNRIHEAVERVLLNRDPAEAAAHEAKLMQDFKDQSKTIGAAFDTLNQITMVSMLYARPGYFLPNLLGQVGLVMTDHFLNPVNLSRSSKLAREINRTNPEFGMVIRAAMQQGLTDIVQPKIGRYQKVATVHDAVARFYGKMLDTPFRDASFINEARRAGFHTRDQIMSLAKPENLGELTSIARRANRNIIDFGRMGEKERTFVRRVIAFYPWMKGASLWTARWMGHHPAQAGVGVAIGRVERERLLKLFGGAVPHFMEGMFQGPDINVPGLGNLSQRKTSAGVMPRLINPRAITVQGTLGETLGALRSLVAKDAPPGEAVGLLHPLVSAGVSTLTRTDPLTGARFPGNMGPLDILSQELLQIPSLGGMFRGEKRARDLAHGKEDATKLLTVPGRGEALTRFLFGATPVTFNPRQVQSRAAAEKASYQELPEKTRLRYRGYEKQIMQASRDLKVGWTSVPPPLRRALANRMAIAENRARFQDEKGHELSAAERLEADLNLAVRQKKLTEKNARTLLTRVNGLPDSALSRVDTTIRRGFFNDYYYNMIVRLFNKGLAAKKMPLLSVA